MGDGVKADLVHGYSFDCRIFVSVITPAFIDVRRRAFEFCKAYDLYSWNFYS